jgi:hypothetical protein
MDTKPSFLDRVPDAVDDGFLDQIKIEAGGVVMRIASGSPVDVALKNFDSIIARTIAAQAKARVIAEQRVKAAL